MREIPVKAIQMNVVNTIGLTFGGGEYQCHLFWKLYQSTSCVFWMCFAKTQGLHCSLVATLCVKCFQIQNSIDTICLIWGDVGAFGKMLGFLTAFWWSACLGNKIHTGKEPPIIYNSIYWLNILLRAYKILSFLFLNILVSKRAVIQIWDKSLNW